MTSLSHYYLASVIWILSATEAYAAEQNNTAEAVVGWDAGPNRRGTLRLITSCVATIFACTWTVLHLNVPGHRDSAGQRLLRKIKWLAISVLFPEFTFSKAVCDLRLALDELRKFDEGSRINGPMEWKRGHCRGNWGIEYPPYPGLLYRLLGLQWPPKGPPSPNHASTTSKFPAIRRHSSVRDCTNSVSQNQKSDEDKDTELHDLCDKDCDKDLELAVVCVECSELTTPTWSVVHSYYAQMGGILCLHTHAGRDDLDGCFPFTSPTMIWAFDWADDQHPLKNFSMRREDIQDKSKADWFAKGISILQITWTILNVTVRGVTGLPSTQLEITAFAFAVMAIGIYLANWWKPKDVSRPTIQSASFLSHETKDIWELPSVQTFTDGMRWHWSNQSENPAPKSFREWNFANVRRVENNLVWMEGEPPYFYIMVGVSSVVFGGMHCIAWDFEFPSRTELVCWRIASLISAILPVLVLGLNFVLEYTSSNYGRSRRNNILIAELEPLRCLSSSWWRAAMSASFMSWNTDEKTAFWLLQNGGMDWEERPSKETIRNTRLENDDREDRWAHKAELTTEFFSAFTQFGQHWDSLRTLGKKNTKPKNIFKDLYHQVEAINSSFPSMKIHNEAFWASYENRLKHTVPGSGAQNLGAPVVEHILKAFQHAEGEFGRLQEQCEHAAKILANCSSVVYVAARLMVIILMFTCLRAAPAGVYQITPWTRFLPKIS